MKKSQTYIDQIKYPILGCLLMTAAVFLVYGPALHETIAWYIARSNGVAANIHFGSLVSNDCPFACQANFTTHWWTSYNQTEAVAAIRHTSFEREEAINESNAVQSLTTLICELPVILWLCWEMFRKKK